MNDKNHAQVETTVKGLIQSDNLRIIPGHVHQSMRVYADQHGADVLKQELGVHVYVPSANRMLSNYEFGKYSHHIKTDRYDDDKSLSAMIGGYEALEKVMSEAPSLPLKQREEAFSKAQR